MKSIARPSNGLFLVALALALVLAGTASTDRRPYAQTKDNNDTLYILPFWAGFGSASPDGVARELADMRRRLGPEEPNVRLGFSGYVFISMDDWDVDPSNAEAVRGALKGTIAQIDAYVDKARAARVPIALALLTAIRERVDPVQRSSQEEDVRNTQWYADNSAVAGWWTHSRYARKMRAVQEAYIREVGKVIANRMRKYPETLVAAAGDGEVELAIPREGEKSRTDGVFADYSPFVVAEFRDWLRLGGLYAAGQSFAGQGYTLGARYAGDRSPAEDSNRDGHTLNGDAGTSFRSWSLLHFDWSLTDQTGDADPHAIPLRQYGSGSVTRLPGTLAGGFDAPRTPRTGKGDPWWELWVLFKQTMLQHHNTDFARWVTTSADPETGAFVPRARWFSYQIPSDYGFNGSPENPTERFTSSMSAWWTADVSPFGSLGITAFNLDFRQETPPSPPTYTLRHVAPRIAERGLRWGIIEWNPGLLPDDSGTTSDVAIYREEMALIERYHPNLLQPFAWGDKVNRVQDTGFEIGLRELMARINSTAPPRLSVNRAALRFGAVARGPITPVQTVQLDQTGWTRVEWRASSAQPWIKISPTSGRGPTRLTVQADPTAPAMLSAGELNGVVTITAPGASGPATVAVTISVTADRATAAPFGQIDSPPQGVTGVAGVVPVTGWALDDIGLTHIKVYRQCLAEDAPARCETVAGNRVVFLGHADIFDDARPDVAAAFATIPQSYRGGWGYLLSTADLPDTTGAGQQGGRGVFDIYAFATDVEGKTTLLGRSQADHTPTRITVRGPELRRLPGA